MTKTVLIVEKDTGLIDQLTLEFRSRGFEVEASSDGRAAPDLIRRSRPDCVVLAVDLDAGQNGYFICKKLKSDDELKPIPIIIIGDPKGFGPHKKLKTRADEYLAKPFDSGEIIDRVGAMIGFPDDYLGGDLNPPEEIDPLDDNGLEPLAMAESLPSDLQPIASDADNRIVTDPGFERIDGLIDPAEEVDSGYAMANDVPLAMPQPVIHPVVPPSDDDDYERTIVGFGPPDGSPGLPALFTQSTVPVVETADLRSKVAELSSALDDVRVQNTELQSRIATLEADVDAKQKDLDAARATGGKGDNKEIFALRDAANKKDKEVLKLRSELNSKDQEIVDLHEKENALEQRLAESADENALKDAQIKTLGSKLEASQAERKKFEAQASMTKDELRAVAAKLATTQTDLELQQAKSSQLESQLDAALKAHFDLDAMKASVDSELLEARGERDALKLELDDRSREVDELRHQADQMQADLDLARTEAARNLDEKNLVREQLFTSERRATSLQGQLSMADRRNAAQVEVFAQLKSTLVSAIGRIEGAEVDTAEPTTGDQSAA